MMDRRRNNAMFEVRKKSLKHFALGKQNTLFHLFRILSAVVVKGEKKIYE
jgi:hypothetical protein